MAKKQHRKYPPMSPKERQAWIDLDWYIRQNVMGYDENQGLNTNMVLRLKGLRWGQCIANTNNGKFANYTFDVILNTYKFCLPKIKKAFEYKRFDNDEHKFNYALAIVNRNIAEVYQRMKNMENANKIAEVNASKSENAKIVEYKNTNDNKKKQKKFNDMW